MIISVDDSQLLRLAADPRTRLFSTRQGSTVFWPIILLAGWLPCIAVVLRADFEDHTALWALRALDVAAAPDMSEPGENGLGSSVVYQPPLSTWISGLIVPRLGTRDLGKWLAPSLVATSCAIYVTFLLGWRIGGPGYGLIATLIVCAHPVALQCATCTGPSALGFLLTALTVWGFLGHLDGPIQLVSLRLIAGAVAWGLAILAVGPPALILLVPMTLQARLAIAERRQSEPNDSSYNQIWLATRTLVLFCIAAAIIGGWWELMMFVKHGLNFWDSWWSGIVALNSPDESSTTFLESWLRQNSFLAGWLVVGITSAVRESRLATSEPLRRANQFVLCWWVTAILFRLLFEIPTLRMSVQIESWDAQLLLPTALLMATGVRSLIERSLPPSAEAALPIVAIALSIWRVTNRPLLGAAGGIFGLVVLAFFPTIVGRFRNGVERWTERDWKKFLRYAIAGPLVLHLATGLFEVPETSRDSLSLVELRRRIALIGAVPRVTLLTLGKVPESLLFVLKNHWPESQFVIAGSNDAISVAEAGTVNTPSAIVSEIVVEWTKREFRLATEFTPNRQTTAVGEPLGFRGRRLMIYRVGPRDH